MKCHIEDTLEWDGLRVVHIMGGTGEYNDWFLMRISKKRVMLHESIYDNQIPTDEMGRMLERQT